MDLEDFPRYLGPDKTENRLIPTDTVLELLAAYWISKLERKEHGPKIRALREMKGLSQEALSEKSRITQTQISRIESGETLNPHLSTIKILYDALLSHK
jgi:DNA-binding XRE family transcriptional regulator